MVFVSIEQGLFIILITLTWIGLTITGLTFGSNRRNNPLIMTASLFIGLSLGIYVMSHSFVVGILIMGLSIVFMLTVSSYNGNYSIRI